MFPLQLIAAGVLLAIAALIPEDTDNGAKDLNSNAGRKRRRRRPRRHDPESNAGQLVPETGELPNERNAENGGNRLRGDPAGELRPDAGPETGGEIVVPDDSTPPPETPPQ